VGMLIAATAATILVTLPWWPGLLSTIEPLTERVPLPRIAWFIDFSWSYLNRGLGMYLLALAIVGLAWAFIQRRRFALILMVWTVLLYAIANLGVISPRLNGVINNSSVTIALFVPITCLAGYLIAWVYTGWRKVVRIERRWIIQTGFGILVLATCLPAARTTLTILNPVTVLSRQADLEAIDWVESNLPKDAVIAVNPFLWGYGIYAGSDGGFWLAPLAGRQTLPPPVLSGIDSRSQATLETRRLTAQIFAASRDPAELSRILSDAGVGYVFVGSRAGAFSAKALAESPFFKEIYGENGVRIFEILPDGRGD